MRPLTSRFARTHRWSSSLLVACAIVACAPLGGCDASPAGPSAAGDLDIARYRLTFSETFSSFDVSAHGPGTRWSAHTPWNGDFGDAKFADPTPGFPFQTASDILRIEARKDAEGHWQSGLISSRDHDGPDGPGFAQRYGYFEIETMLPAGTGVWPAFWLVGVTASPRAEIDVMEYYGNNPGAYRVAVHVWSDDPALKYGAGPAIPIPPGSATSQFNRYGVDIEPDFVTFYFNRKSVWRTPTRPAFRQPMYILADLALGSGWPIDKVADPSFMYIKSIAAYQRR